GSVELTIIADDESRTHIRQFRHDGRQLAGGRYPKYCAVTRRSRLRRGAVEISVRPLNQRSGDRAGRNSEVKKRLWLKRASDQCNQERGGDKDGEGCGFD